MASGYAERLGEPIMEPGIGKNSQNSPSQNHTAETCSPPLEFMSGDNWDHRLADLLS